MKIKDLLFICSAFLFGVLISGCSTMEGLGKDMQNIGQGIGSSTSGNKTSKSDSSPPESGAVVTPIK